MIVLITGPEGAGKTTAGDAVARGFDRGVHVDGDVFRRFIVTGRREMSTDADAEALAQLRVRYELAHTVARGYAAVGFDVVVSDVVGGALLTEVAPRYDRVVVLMPDEQLVVERRGSRHRPWVYRLFAEETDRIGTWIDNSHLTPEETAAAILRV